MITQPNWSQETYLKACRFAAEAHQGQRFPGTELPYLYHLPRRDGGNRRSPR